MAPPGISPSAENSPLCPDASGITWAALEFIAPIGISWDALGSIAPVGIPAVSESPKAPFMRPSGMPDESAAVMVPAGMASIAPVPGKSFIDAFMASP
jgi:hypothetical protein